MDLFPETLKIILLLFPGLVALFATENMIGQDTRKRDSIDRLFIAFSYTIPAFAITIGLFKLVALIPPIGKIIEKYYQNNRLFNWYSGDTKLENFLVFLVIYIFLGFLSGILVSYFVVAQLNEKSISRRISNKIRRILNKPDIGGGISPWDKLFCNRESQVIEVIRPDGERIKGLLKDFTFAGDEVREIVLEGIKEVSEGNDYLQNVKYVYYHFNSGTIIKVFDIKEWQEALEKEGKNV
ncbi:hypothetical protein Calhy_0777 [Caldicellulosiruptor hydrothermalis 108]|uniref:Uncharacterized protein n=1 Tax=Caldicellulosiruptor hydrothermalis (strain DSM 18901 / VKM B-2411 / 108) TaxID=632292 RepID=E4QE20_CALH1|nr:DUF6338 family protein [Caldicellulosiruptor hydrothermalis]ADQ06514.1 hypothetical protein Calhy_0777 [Caldicellulosiruptor hydrothermalis 108]